MAADRSPVDELMRREAPGSESRERAQDRARPPQDPRAARAMDRATRNRAAGSRAEELNFIRPRRVLGRASPEQRSAVPAAAKGADPRAAPETPAPPTSAAKPPDAAASSSGDLWALPQSIRDRFVEDKRRFYFP